MIGTLLKSTWAITPEMMTRIKAAYVAGGMIEIGAALPAPRVARKGGMAHIPIRGVMVKRMSILGALFGETSTVAIGEAFQAAFKDPTVQSILLHIDSPGGVTDGLAELGDMVFQARQAGGTKIVAQVDGMAASAAYYVASQAHEIYANRLDLVGSIGTRAEVIDTSKALEAAGVEVLSIDSGPLKSMGVDGVPVTDEHKAEIQRIVDTLYADFLNTVQRGRGMSALKLTPLADGGLFFAPEAKANGLIDGIRTVSETVLALTTRRQSGNRQRQSTALDRRPPAA